MNITLIIRVSTSTLGEKKWFVIRKREGTYGNVPYKDIIFCRSGFHTRHKQLMFFSAPFVALRDYCFSVLPLLIVKVQEEEQAHKIQHCYYYTRTGYTE